MVNDLEESREKSNKEIKDLFNDNIKLNQKNKELKNKLRQYSDEIMRNEED